MDSKKIHVFCLDEVVGCLGWYPTKPTLGIRCLTPGREYEPLFLEKEYVDVLSMRFDDIRDLKQAEGCVVFNEQHAEEIRDFVEKNKNRFLELMVHCDAGVSRSCAVGAAIGDYYGWQYDGAILTRHIDGVNPLVYEILTRVLRA